MPYNSLYLVSFIRDLFRNMFHEYGGDKMSWDKDPRKSDLVIGTVNDVNSEDIAQKFPRILIQRGASLLQSQFIANNLQTRVKGGVAEGGTDIFRQDVQGSINIIIETRNEGTCEELGELLRRFICWCKPFIESTFRFQAFAKTVQISSCEMDQEDTEKFKININIPYIVEDRWMKSGDLVRLNHIFSEMTNIDQAVN